MSDTDLTALLRAAKEEPDDDLPRLILADWLEDRGDARAEFVRLQCQLARTPAGDPRLAGWKAREREMLAAHACRWIGGLRRFTRFSAFERGLLFLRLASLDALLHTQGQAERRTEAFAWVTGMKCHVPNRLLPRLLKQTDAFAGLTHLKLLLIANDGGASFAQLLGSPHLGLLTYLDLAGCRVGDEGIAALARSSHMCRLRSLNLSSCRVGDDGVAELARSPYLGRLAALNLWANPVGDRGAELLAGSTGLGTLRNVNVSGQHPLEPRIGPGGEAALRARFGEGFGRGVGSMPPLYPGQDW